LETGLAGLLPPPPSHRDRTPFSFVAPMSPERGLFEFLRVSISVSKRRNGRFCAPVSAAKNSVPGSRFGDWFDDCVGSMQFGPDRLHHPVFPNRGNRRRSKRGRFCGDLAAYFQRSRSLPTITVSRVDFWPPVSASKNSVPGDRISDGNLPGGARGSSAEKRGSSSVGTYCGFNPRVSNWRLHSAGASRSRSTPIPRGKRPSTAALMRSGARNAREMVILT
jgi:hypothetical protein